QPGRREALVTRRSGGGRNGVDVGAVGGRGITYPQLLQFVSSQSGVRLRPFVVVRRLAARTEVYDARSTDWLLPSVDAKPARHAGSGIGQRRFRLAARQQQLANHFHNRRRPSTEAWRNAADGSLPGRPGIFPNDRRSAAPWPVVH